MKLNNKRKNDADFIPRDERINMPFHNRKGEKRRTRDRRKAFIIEATDRLSKNPLNILYIMFLVAVFVFVWLLLDALLYIAIVALSGFEQFLQTAEALNTMFSIILGNVEHSYIVQNTPNMNNAQMVGAWIVKSVLAVLFIVILWRKLLPWIGRPKMPKHEIARIEDELAVDLRLSPQSYGYFKRPAIISRKIPVKGADVEEYIFWSGVSVDKWNAKEIKNEILNTLGGNMRGDFENVKSSGSKRIVPQLNFLPQIADKHIWHIA